MEDNDKKHKDVQVDDKSFKDVLNALIKTGPPEKRSRKKRKKIRINPNGSYISEYNSIIFGCANYPIA